MNKQPETAAATTTTAAPPSSHPRADEEATGDVGKLQISNWRDFTNSKLDGLSLNPHFDPFLVMCDGSESTDINACVAEKDRHPSSTDSVIIEEVSSNQSCDASFALRFSAGTVNHVNL